ncbi:MAG: hypothetical protein HZB13_12035 [Acidobacteria bacterium]|nr:hypothetical protein [Acidobacteriota bacterium]
MAPPRPPDDAAEFRPAEFWQEEARASRADIRRQFIRWTLVFIALVCAVIFALWWAGSTVHFSASRVDESTRPTWRLFGVVTDAATGEAVPFARIADDPHGRFPHFQATADHLGHYELLTIAEKHSVVVSALGYRPASAAIGRNWFLWMPSGDQRLDVTLTRE